MTNNQIHDTLQLSEKETVFSNQKESVGPMKTMTKESRVKSRIKADDLEERTYQFAKQTIEFCKEMPKGIANCNIYNHLVRCSTAIGASYIGASLCLFEKEFHQKLTESIKAAKESQYWFRLLMDTNDPAISSKCQYLLQEAAQLEQFLALMICENE